MDYDKLEWFLFSGSPSLASLICLNLCLWLLALGVYIHERIMQFYWNRRRVRCPLFGRAGSGPF